MRKPKRIGGAAKVILIAAAVILLLELVLVIWLERKPDPKPGGSKPPVSTTETQKKPGKPSVSFKTDYVVTDASVKILALVENQIQTPYFPLYYPEDFSDLLVVAKTAEEPFSLEFYAMLEGRPEQRLFDIRLSEKHAGNMGIVKTENAEISVNITFYTPSMDNWTEDEINTVLAMQEAANETIGRLNLEEPTGQPAFRETAPEPSVVNMLSVQTPFCALRYPVRWAEYLVAEHTEDKKSGIYKVLFRAEFAGKEKCPLFTVVFDGEEGTPLGIIQDESGKSVAVNIQIGEPNLDGWRDEDAQIVYAMQEAVNDLISQLPLE